jgi:hypothetical protein
MEIYYRKELIESLETVPPRHVAPCSLLANRSEIPGLVMACPDQEIQYFKIIKSVSPEPGLKFRMMNFSNKAFTLEIWLDFQMGDQKLLKLHLNPHDGNVKKFLKLGLETKMISFIFYNSETQEMSTAVTEIDPNHLGWFERNVELSSHLKADNKGYAMLADFLKHDISITDRLYNYLPRRKADFFIGKSKELVGLGPQ